MAEAVEIFRFIILAIAKVIDINSNVINSYGKWSQLAHILTKN